MKVVFVKGSRCRLDDAEFVEQRLKKAFPYTYQNLVYRVTQRKMGAFKHFIVEYGHSDTSAAGPTEE